MNNTDGMLRTNIVSPFLSSGLFVTSPRDMACGGKPPRWHDNLLSMRAVCDALLAFPQNARILYGSVSEGAEAGGILSSTSPHNASMRPSKEIQPGVINVSDS